MINICKSKRLVLTLTVTLLLIPTVIALGIWLLDDRRYGLISVLVAILAALPFFIRFERRETSVRELIVIAVMTALSAVGRIVFAPIPFFKPVSAVTVISGIAFGPEAGFLIGSLSAVVSNFFYGQGPWTPFQMFLWGIIGFAAGFIFKKGKPPHFISLILSGAISGAAFSLGMDVWATLAAGGGFSLSRYLAYASAALPVTVVYAVSNAVFLLLLAKPLLSKTERLRIKFDIFK